MYAAPSLPTIGSLPPPNGGARVAIAEGDLHLWYCNYDGVRDPKLLAAYHALLRDDERAKRAKLVFEKDRHEFLVTRALVRSVLSRYAPVPLDAWEFGKNAYGRPFARNPELGGLAFNLSHSNGMVVCAVSRGHTEMGVDVEDAERTSVVDIADQFFSKSEVAALNALPAELRPRRFFWYWTLKEAYIKARGMGLSVPLDKFSFSFAHDLGHAGDGANGHETAIRISFEPPLNDDPARWQFGLIQASRRHTLAYGVKSLHDARTRPVVRARHVIPLEERIFGDKRVA
jgi:4'-phosphopantetheinyl transferase